MRQNVQVSSVRPFHDESLMSFLQRAQAAGGVTDEKFHSWIAGAPLSDAWLAERRAFDWHSLSRFVNATAEELHGMSQRSLLHAMHDERRSGLMRQRAPWVQTAGYSAHCPCCFKESPHWRKSWLSPAALVCERHETVLLRHCEACGGSLENMNWTQVQPICPNCHSHLSLNPVVTAPRVLADEAAKIGSRYNRMLARAPVSRSDFDLAHYGAVWRAARLFSCESNGLQPVLEEIFSLHGIQDNATKHSADWRALQHVQNFLVAHSLAEVEPTFSEHFWVSVDDGRVLRRADDVVLFKLQEIARSLAIKLVETEQVVGQLTISFASWDGLNGMPKAA